MDKIAIVILNWNGLNFLEQFLPFVINYSNGAAIYVADNNSTDASVEFLRRNYSGSVSVIEMPSNEGFSKGYNIALRQIEARYYILLNSDVEVTEDWLHPVISFMDNNEDVAACQPKIKSFYERDSLEYAGAAGGFIDKTGYPFCRGRIFGTIEKDQGQYDDVLEVFWATGACLFVRADVYWELGGLDDDFFAHMEEIDLCWRFKNAGYKIYYFGFSEVFHIGGGTLDKTNSRKTFLNFRNGLFLLYKNLPQGKLYSILFKRMVLDGIAAFKFLFFDSYKHFFAVVHAHFAFYAQIPALRRKRKNMLPLVKGRNHKQIYKGSIVLDYFFKGKEYFKELRFRN